MNDVRQLLEGNRYPGRGIIAGQTESGEPLFAYFIMGRSAGSRNRIFRAEGPEVFTRPYDPTVVSDPSLIIYRAVALCDDGVVVSNGDQTDTIVEGLAAGQSFSD
ncbi:MAG: IMP cyclohydrolase, partial [Sphaerochaetaceae bacterium]